MIKRTYHADADIYDEEGHSVKWFTGTTTRKSWLPQPYKAYHQYHESIAETLRITKDQVRIVTFHRIW